jgi:hypothetical protein
MNSHNHFDFNFEQMIEMTRTACLAARSADNKSRKIVEILLPWGEYYAAERETIPPLVYVDMVIQTGCSFDSFGLQLHFGRDQTGMHIRDMMQISAKLDCFGPLSRPLHITGVAVPSSWGTDDTGPAGAGFWHRQWDPDMQAEWIEQVYKIALAKPFVNSITYSHFADSGAMEVPAGGLLTEELEPKQALLTLAKLQKLILNK